jgi:hypothetical protein
VVDKAAEHGLERLNGPLRLTICLGMESRRHGEISAQTLL